jgi:hypothetical protein
VTFSISHWHDVSHVIPFIVQHITGFVSLRNDISLQMTGNHIIFICQLGFLPWYAHPHLFEHVLDDLEHFYHTSQWFIQEEILHFLHIVYFTQMFVFESRIFKKIFDGLLALFLQNERGELRMNAVKLVQMLISMIWDDFGDFFR